MAERTLSAALLAACMLASLTCSDPSAPLGAPGITFVAGFQGSDTAATVREQALVVEVRDASGRLAPEGTWVRFASAVSGGAVDPVSFASLNGTTFSTLIAPPTDRNGRATVLVRLGIRAGTARVVVNVPTMGFTDTASYTVLPGQAANVVVTPADTALTAGQSYPVSGRVVDAHGNERDDPVTWTSESANVTVSNAGLVTPTAPGRYVITGVSGSVNGSAALSVLPAFRLVAWQTYPESRIVSMNLDGSDRRNLAAVQDGGIGAHPAWIPGTATAIYSSVEGGHQRLRVVDDNGVSSLFMPALPAGMTHQAEPAPSADGSWMYFIAFNTACQNAADYCVHRSSITGASPTLTAAGYPTRHPAPSPDGSRAVYRYGDYGELRVVDMATNTVAPWPQVGFRPAWSPLGTKIAFVADGHIALANPDGQGRTTLTSLGSAQWEGPVRWSPDGNWIIARFAGQLALVEVATRAIIPIPGTAMLAGGSLR